MEVNSFFSEVNNIKNFDVIIVDAYSYNAIIYIPEHESLDPFFFRCGRKGETINIFNINRKKLKKYVRKFRSE